VRAATAISDVERPRLYRTLRSFLADEDPYGFVVVSAPKHVIDEDDVEDDVEVEAKAKVLRAGWCRACSGSRPPGTLP
jgi:hypothetical protein